MDVPSSRLCHDSSIPRTKAWRQSSHSRTPMLSSPLLVTRKIDTRTQSTLDRSIFGFAVGGRVLNCGSHLLVSAFLAFFFLVALTRDRWTYDTGLSRSRNSFVFCSKCGVRR
ncbi:hypothetical protein K474DRAFT_1670042 [Panus rudis PR-1116 ss-1]|nr:hypothetical protein K474DRAFT_1670042 [Panus rudis PR-1116 ss-1]